MGIRATARARADRWVTGRRDCATFAGAVGEPGLSKLAVLTYHFDGLNPLVSISMATIPESGSPRFRMLSKLELEASTGAKSLQAIVRAADIAL